MAGRIPSDIGQYSQLKNLSLYENQLTGAWISYCHIIIIVLIDGKRVNQLTEMRWYNYRPFAERIWALLSVAKP